MSTLSNYWRSVLKSNRYLMEPSTITLIEQTIRELDKAEKAQKVTRVQREVDIVRTVKDLNSVKEVDQ